jgi:hypothetical protein
LNCDVAKKNWLYGIIAKDWDIQWLTMAENWVKQWNSEWGIY